VILDEGERAIRADELNSAVDYSPYDGKVLRAWPHATVCGGALVYQDGKFANPDSHGEMLILRFAGAG
jgi:dihydropyrimidinase